MDEPHLKSSDELEMLDSVVPDKSKKQRYAQKYRASWETEPLFEGWLQPSSKGPLFAYCTNCDAHLSLTSGKTDLKKHATGKKHVKNSSSPPRLRKQRKRPNVTFQDFERSVKRDKGYHVTSLINLNDMKVGFIGAANMAQSLALGFLNAGILSREQIHVSSAIGRHKSFWEDLDPVFCSSNTSVMKKCNIIFFTVKPNVFTDFVNQLLTSSMLSEYFIKEDENQTEFEQKLLVSVMSGVTINIIENAFQNIVQHPRVIRMATNTCTSIGHGCTVFSTNNNCSMLDVALLEALMSGMGLCRNVAESQMDVCTALLGSGNAFVYLVMEALTHGAVMMGLPYEVANEFTTQVIKGSSEMVKSSGKLPEELRNEVLSAGGTTMQGIYELEKGSVRASLMSAVRASTMFIETLTKRAEEQVSSSQQVYGEVLVETEVESTTEAEMEDNHVKGDVQDIDSLHHLPVRSTVT